MREGLKKIRESGRKEIEEASTREELEKLRVQFLGRERGALTMILRQLKSLPEKERAVIGNEANRLKNTLEALFEKRSAELKEDFRGSQLKKEHLDVTHPGIRAPRGHLHPITKILREVEHIFLRMGFTIAEGPEIETEHYNFDALNMAEDHPARDMQDTFWLKTENKTQDTRNKLLLRTHTSSVQIRYMESHQPPIRIIVPGLVYRHEATDAAHDIEYWQLEGLAVDKNITVGNFKAVIERFFSELFGKSITTRLRPYYFPYTEPSFEVDVSCTVCGGKGCSLCSHTGWLEMMGAGMVHPEVFKNVGYNPKEVQGFAFGMGFDRLVTMKYKIPDVRLMRSGDLRFLSQF